MRSRALVALTLFAGCGFEANPGKSIDAPPGTGDSGVDAAPDPDAASDGPPPADAPSSIACYGSSFGRVCLSSAPTNTITLGTATTIDTDTSSMCALTFAGTTIANACVVPAMSWTINARYTARGSRALVLVAVNAITISTNGAIDVSSSSSPTVRGAGAQLLCAGGTPASGNGGGAGGSNNSVGGSGGNGSTGNGGSPSSTSGLSSLRGGCPGSPGGNGGAGGFGGGAVDLIAGSIIVNGAIIANGAGGTGGPAGDRGGGGGGSGGVIVLDTQNLVLSASTILLAQGGGGGGGSTGGAAPDGSEGSSLNPGVAAVGGSSGGNAGTGGEGGTTGSGSNGGGANGNAGGGGGGGGVGYLRTLDPSFSPGGMTYPNFN
ncbi:MAG: hypothetical protein H0T46_12200 [Deltaproteobacteria bacterium]|nr:hypothetical protein [Deltaproteobacteria bacterium]